MSTQELIKQADRAFSSEERTNKESIWQELAEYIWLSQSGLFNGVDAKGQKKTQNIFEPSGVQAAEDLSSAIHSVLTNPSTTWSNLVFGEDALNEKEANSAFINRSKDKIHKLLNESNFDIQISKTYRSTVVLGSAPLFIEEKKDEVGRFNGFRFQALHLSEIAWQENFNGEVDTVYRKYRLTYKKLMERWEDSLPEEIKRNAKEFPDREEEIYFIVAPREEHKKSRGLLLPKDRPVAGFYMLKRSGILLEETGFYEQPYFIPRWMTRAGEVYGMGPGEMALPEIRTINQARKLALEAAPLAIRKPLKVSEKDLISDINIAPGDLTVLENSDSLQPIDLGTNFSEVQFLIQESRDMIRSMFYLDKLFLPPRTETGEMTAFEVDQRLAQMQRVLGPTLARFNYELLAPLIVTCFRMLLRGNVEHNNELLGPMPPQIAERGLDIEVKFVNQLSRAQELEELQAIQSFLQQDLAMVAQFKPEAIDLINFDGIVERAVKIRNLFPEITLPDEVVDAVREQRAEAAQAQQQLEAGIGVADILSKTQGITDNE